MLRTTNTKLKEENILDYIKLGVRWWTKEHTFVVSPKLQRAIYNLTLVLIWNDNVGSKERMIPVLLLPWKWSQAIDEAPKIQNMDQLCRLVSVEHREVGRDWKGFSPQKVWSPKMSPYVNHILFDTIASRTKTKKKRHYDSLLLKTLQLYWLWYIRATGRPEITRDSSKNWNGFAQNNRISYTNHICINRNKLRLIQVGKTYMCTVFGIYLTI